MNTDILRKASTVIYLATEAEVADSISTMLLSAADDLDITHTELEDLRGKVRRWDSSIEQYRHSPRGDAKHMAKSDLEAAEYALRAAVEKGEK